MPIPRPGRRLHLREGGIASMEGVGTALTAAECCAPVLDEALRTQTLAHVFQPIWDLETGELLGFEAFARFPGGPPPDAVWRAARQRDLWRDLDRLSIREALRQARGLPGRLFVNVSGRYLTWVQPGTGAVRQAIASYRPGSGAVVIEVTEDEAEPLAPRPYGAERLRAARIPLALDDGGAGAATLHRLEVLRPYLAYVKLDRQLVRQWAQGAGAELERWVRRALRYGLPVIAEGIEERGSAVALAAAGVRFGQGYGLGRPQPAPAWTAAELRGAAPPIRHSVAGRGR